MTSLGFDFFLREAHLLRASKVPAVSNTTTRCYIRPSRFTSSTASNTIESQKTSRVRHSSCPEVDAAEDRPRIRPLSPSTTSRLTPSPPDNATGRRDSTSSHPANESWRAARHGDKKEQQDHPKRKKSDAEHKKRSRSRAVKRTTCSDEARDADLMSVDELAGYFDAELHIPRSKLSFMAELMYT